MPIIRLQSTAGAVVEAHDYGAHVTSWRTADGVERLFLSQRAEFREGVAIRGGVPIIFPQFAGFGPYPKHGFARTARWQQVTIPGNSPDSAVFRLQDSTGSRVVWPHRFVADYTITLQHDALQLTLSIRNDDTQPFSFTAALHAYLRVADIAEVRVLGVQGLKYIDSAAGGMHSVETDPELHIAGEVDRIYLSTQQPIQVVEPGQRSIVCSAQGFTDVVIWNPGAEKAAQLSDLEPGGFRHMLCVEAAIVGVPVELQPQASWSGVQQLQLG
jgi:glucose-6-phosphate 1-epimerase